ncbi:MAG: hypothetical protein JSW47_02765 [Phycisphaerales bacterium]|nr:MAG: hypothetical protein JSW47_02765 [Phycisphaerales bacterium]
MDRIVFDFPPAFYVGLPLAVAVLMLSVWTQLRRGIARRWVAFSTASRGAALLILILLAARPVWVETPIEDKPRDTVVLLADRSSSMSLEDGETTRFEHLLTFARDELVPALTHADLRVRGYLFAEDAEAVDGAQMAAATPDGSQTNLSGAIVEALTGAVERLLAVIALTDGAVNVRRDDARAVTALLESGVPLIGIGFGSETDVRTLSLRRAIAPPCVPPNQEFHLSAQLEMSSVAEMPPFDLLLLRDGTFVESKTVSAGAGQRLWLEHFAVREKIQGVHTYTIQLQPPDVEGLRCMGTLAAERVRIFRGRDLRILYAQAAPGWNYKFIRMALRSDPTIKLTGLTRTSTESIFRQDVADSDELADWFPSTVEDIASFGVVVLSNLRPSDLTSTQQELLKRFCSELGGGVLMIGGDETFGSSWRNSQLEQLLPVLFTSGPPRRQSTGPYRPGTAMYSRSPSPNRRPPSFGLQLTDAALGHPVFQIDDSGKQRAAWARLPRFTQCARVEQAKLGTQIWAVNSDEAGPDGRPRILMAQQRYGAGISAVICVRDLWQWRLAKDRDPQSFDRFWQQFFHYLNEAAGEEVVVRFADQDLSPAANIGAIIERRLDPQAQGEARSYRVQIEDDQKKLIKDEKIELVPGQSVEVTFKTDTAGICTVKVLSANRTALASRSVEIRQVNMEFQHAGRNMERLRQWANLTGGVAVKAEHCDNAGELIAQVKAQAEQPSRASDSRIPAGVNHWVLITLLACLCGEWALRKRGGLR